MVMEVVGSPSGAKEEARDMQMLGDESKGGGEELGLAGWLWG